MTVAARWTKSLRWAIAFAVSAGLWLFSAPAFAAAPQCDTRGATTLAPAPTLDAPNASIDVGADEAADCAAALLAAAYHRGGAPTPMGASDAPDAVLTGTVGVVPGVCTGITPLAAIEGAPRAGVRVTIERPPR